MFNISWMNVAEVFAVINVALVVLLIYAYVQSWRNVHSGFTVSLIVFAAFFLIQNVVIITFWYVLLSLNPSSMSVVEGAAPYLTAINAMEAVGLGTLTRSAWK